MVSDGRNIVNFPSFAKSARETRKQTAKRLKEEQAAANRVRFARSGADKKADKLKRERERRDMDGKLREDGEDES
ncbi:MAG: DUF4169 family protein [Parvibaculum sp.]|nr:DUF4169 family protein [Parvibaculum sp.]